MQQIFKDRGKKAREKEEMKGEKEGGRLFMTFNCHL